jgi:hypothetical protein
VGKSCSQFFNPVHSIVVIPTGFKQDHDSAVSDDTSSWVEAGLLDDALKSYSGSLLGTPESNKGPDMLGILEPTGNINWLYPSPSQLSPLDIPPLKISLLSLDCVDYIDGIIGTRIEGDDFPVLAVTQSTPSTWKADVTLNIRKNENREEVEKTNTAEVGDDLIKIIWTRFNPKQFEIKKFEAGMQGQLRIKLWRQYGNQGSKSIHLIQNFKLL